MLRPTRAQWVLRWDHVVELALGMLATYVALRCLRWESTTGMRLFWTALASSFFVATIGVWFAREWARWVFGLLAALSAVGCGVQTIINLMSTDEGSPIVYGVVGVLWGVVAHRMLRPSTGRQFSWARGAGT